jgi:hypothetical protein
MAKFPIIPGVVGAMLIITGALLFHFLPIFVKNRAKADMVLATPTSMMYKPFQNTSSSTDVYYDYYFNNLTNEADVLKGAPPILQEVGPYRYLLLQYKDADSIKWHPNATVSYTYHQVYVFQPQLSGGRTEEDIFITPNLGWIGALQKLDGIMPSADAWWLVGQAAAKVNATWFVALTAKEIAWGYNNSVLEALGQPARVALDTNDDPTTFTATSAQYTMGDAAYNEPPSQDGPYMTRWAGNEGVLQNKNIFGQLEYYWGDKYASMINGSNGESYKPDLDESARPYVFVDNLFRSVILEYIGTSSLRDIPLMTYTLSAETLASSKQNPNNAALFVDVQGFMARPPFKNQPIWISNPRFLGCDMTNVNLTVLPEVDINANSGAYRVELDVETITGEIFRANKRFQINALLNASVTVPANFVTTYYPIAWINLNSEIPPSMTDKFKDRVQNPLKISEGVSIAAMIGGALMIMISGYLFVKNSNMHSPPMMERESLLQ